MFCLMGFAFSQIRLALMVPTFFVQRDWSVGRQNSSDLGFLGVFPGSWVPRGPCISGSSALFCSVLLCVAKAKSKLS